MLQKLLTCLLILLLSVGCAERRFYPPPPDVRANLTDIAVIASAGAAAPSLPDSPVKGAGQGAAVGAGQGAVGSLAGGLQAGAATRDPLGAIFMTALGVVLAPPAAVIGGVVGASRAHPADEVTAAERNFRQTLAEIELLETLHDEVTDALRKRTSLRVFDIPASNITDYSVLSDKKVDTILEIAVTRFEFEVDGRISPDITIHLVTEARLVSAVDRQEVYRRVWAFASQNHNYFELSDNNAALLRSEIETAVQLMAQKMVYDIFVSTTPEEVIATPIGGAVRTLSAAPQPEMSQKGEDGPSDSLTAWQREQQIDRPCNATTDAEAVTVHEDPWLGEWVARKDKAILTLHVEEAAVRGQFQIGDEKFPIFGKVDDHGFIDAAIHARNWWDTANLKGTFPELKIDQPLGAQWNIKLRQFDGETFQMCS